MKGKNTVRLNERSMLEALQMWVDSAFTEKPRAIAVRQITPPPVYDNGTSTQPPGYYEIDVDDGEKDEKKSPAPTGDNSDPQ